jgi:hypothetical protein
MKSREKEKGRADEERIPNPLLSVKFSFLVSRNDFVEL